MAVILSVSNILHPDQKRIQSLKFAIEPGLRCLLSTVCCIYIGSLMLLMCVEDVLTIRVLALYHKGKPFIVLDVLLMQCLERRLTIVLYSLLSIESIVRAAMLIVALLQEKGKCVFDCKFLCSILLDSGHRAARSRRNKLWSRSVP